MLRDEHWVCTEGGCGADPLILMRREVRHRAVAHGIDPVWTAEAARAGPVSKATTTGAEQVL